MRRHARAEVVYRAKVTVTFTQATANFAAGAKRTEYAGVYVRRADAVAAGTRLKNYWRYNDSIVVDIEIEESTLDWKPAVPA